MDDNIFVNEEDKLHDECGVIGVYLNSKTVKDETAQNAPMNAATLAYYGLYSLQHRGQESAGIAVTDGSELKVHKQLGLVADVFKKDDLLSLVGHVAVGHVRYATAGGCT
ncbi:MAG TPA: amidophosphoribosyltransferase, partial [Treponema sp.]|nr:amidophosphoribosyltransferase [Treponema sp.]